MGAKGVRMEPQAGWVAATARTTSEISVQKERTAKNSLDEGTAQDAQAPKPLAEDPSLEEQTTAS